MSRRWHSSHVYRLVPFAFLLATLAIGGCEAHGADLDDALITLGLSDPEPLPARTIDVLVDGTPGSPGGSLPLVVEEVQLAARSIEERPGSRLRVWTLATATDEAQVRFDRVVPERPRTFRASSSSSFADGITPELGPALEPALAEAAEARTSPIAASIERVLLVDAVGERVLVILGDGRERGSGLNRECGSISTRRFRASLARRGILLEGSLRDRPVRIEFARFEMRSLRGQSCRATVARERAIREAWAELLMDAGAVSVAFRSGHAELDLRTASSAAPSAQEEEVD